MKQKKIGQKINWWKWLFLGLLAINIGLLLTLASRLITLREPDAQTVNVKVPKSFSIGTFSTDKDKLNQTILTYLKPYQTSQMTYKLYAANDTVMFEGTYRLFDYDIPLYVYFEPYRLEDGAVQLQVTSFSVGTLPLPQKEVLQYIKSSYDLPDIVKVEPNQSTITIQLQKLKNPNGIFIKAKQIDLLNDDIRFEIYKKNNS